MSNNSNPGDDKMSQYAQEAESFQENENTEVDNQFESFKTVVKVFEDNKEYDELFEQEIGFDSNTIKLADSNNLELIAEEINLVPQRIFVYRAMLDSQTHILQLLEDSYENWFSKKYIEVDQETEAKYDKTGNIVGTKKVERTEGAKKHVIVTQWEEEYINFQNKLRAERYKLSLIKSAVTALDNYSYKLHAVQNYRELLLQHKIEQFNT